MQELATTVVAFVFESGENEELFETNNGPRGCLRLGERVRECVRETVFAFETAG